MSIETKAQINQLEENLIYFPTNYNNDFVVSIKKYRGIAILAEQEPLFYLLLIAGN